VPPFSSVQQAQQYLDSLRQRLLWVVQLTPGGVANGLAVALLHHHGRSWFVYPHLALLIESHLPPLFGDFLRIVGRLGARPKRRPILVTKKEEAPTGGDGASSSPWGGLVIARDGYHAIDITLLGLRTSSHIMNFLSHLCVESRPWRRSSSFGRSRECWRIAEGEAHMSVIGTEANFRRC
jgi:hypothetical protein